MTDMCIYCCYYDFDWQTFWTAAGAIAAIVGLPFVVLQLRHSVRVGEDEIFFNLDAIFTEDNFRGARSKIFNALWDKDASEISNDDIKPLKQDIIDVSRKMNKMCYPRMTILQDRIINTWKIPIGKAWGLLQGYVKYAREKDNWNEPGSEKWKEFEDMGEQCFAKLKLTPEKEKEIKKIADEIYDYFKKLASEEQ